MRIKNHVLTPILLLFTTIAHSVITYKTHLYYSSRDTIGAGNYTYYYLNDYGNFKAQLITLSGDADLYASDKQLKVTFSNYKLQSTTYGEDELYFINVLHRPITIGVYGHPFYESSEYKLNIYLIEHDTDNFEEYTYNDYLNHFSNYNDFAANDVIVSDQNNNNNNNKNKNEKNYNDNNNNNHNNNNNNKRHEKQKEESSLQKILFYLLKFVAEVILD